MRTAALTERQLDTKVRRPADAERYRVEQEAEGRKNSAILTRRGAAAGDHRRRPGRRRAGQALR